MAEGTTQVNGAANVVQIQRIGQITCDSSASALYFNDNGRVRKVSSESTFDSLQLRLRKNCSTKIVWMSQTPVFKKV